MENLRRKFPSLSPLTNSYSVSSSSAITVDSSSSSAPGTSAVWTDEKHRLYLDSLEASFVNQLHHSIALRGGRTFRRANSSHKLPISSCSSSHKESTADSHFLTGNPCVSRFSSASKQGVVACYDLQCSEHSSERVRAGGNSGVCCGLARSSELHSACSMRCHNSVDIALEVSDQNFFDEDQGENSSCMASVKRLR